MVLCICPGIVGGIKPGALAGVRAGVRESLTKTERIDGNGL